MMSNGVMILKAYLQLVEITIELSDRFVVFRSHITLLRSAEGGTFVRSKQEVRCGTG